jgi:hypothetical protein
VRASRDAVARATDLAFRGRFDAALEALPGTSSEESTWVRAYVAASRGELARALRLAGPLAASARARAVRVAASITAASVLRQRGMHAAAERWDRQALEKSKTELERAHALIGLAADAIGRGRSATCARRLDHAEALAVDDWRARVRLDWVRVEHALTTARAHHGLEPGRRAVACSRDADARRHLAKSRLFYGVALADAGFPQAARRELRLAMSGATACGAARVARIARDVLAQKGFAAAG